MSNKLIENIIENARGLGIEKGDILYVASDITRLVFALMDKYGVEGKAGQKEALNQLTDGLKDLVGEEGTLLIPTFSWAFCAGKGFDRSKTKSEVGAYSNFILKNRDDFRRTRHAMYSFAVWGKDAEMLLNMDNQDAWGEKSVFTYLRDNNAKELNIDCEPFQGMTFVHYVEQCVDVPYRHLKYFFGNYTDYDGTSEFRMYSMNVRDMDVSTGVSTTDEYLISKNLAKKVLVDGIGLTLIDLTASYPVIVDDLKNNNGANNIYFKTGGLDWTKEKTLPYEIGKI
ncbi:MAG: AAC(3) family N-acetyltransferase [Lachnospiraceae bacterium]|nr:AAC(3) family N-acetyltransferase [Lachnospiraceae bacterium]